MFNVLFKDMEKAHYVRNFRLVWKMFVTTAFAGAESQPSTDFGRFELQQQLNKLWRVLLHQRVTFCFDTSRQEVAYLL